MTDFTNNAIDLEHLPRYQDLKLTPPHKKYWTLIVINLLIILFVLGAAASIFMLVNGDARRLWPYITAGYVIFAVLLVVCYRISFKNRGFALREKDIVYKHGVIAETTTIVPLNRIQHVALNEGLLSRMFKLGTLQVFTAGGASGHVAIGGIEIEKARNIRETLLQRLDLTTEQINESND